uniref:BED-type domain-containing protein n=1 Tax=Strongyloides venezuelensis TaxID=75913 RepID=A0A0K0F3A2_STRVS
MAESSGDSSKQKLRTFIYFWHVGKKTECSTYSYKLCDYKHDKSASVKQHIASEHREDVFAEDLITVNFIINYYYIKFPVES